MISAERLFRYKSLLTGRRAVPRSEFMAKLEISRATANRDIAYMRDIMNMPIVFDRDLDGYRLEKSDDLKELPGFWFDHEEILALLTIQNMLKQLEPSLLGSKLDHLYKRFNKLLEQEGVNPDALEERLRVAHAGKRRIKLTCFDLVAKATLDRKQLKIQHFNRSTGETIERVISPQQLLNYRDNWYVDAWCHLRNGIRSFAVDAITDCEYLDVNAKELDTEALRKFMQQSYGIFAGEVKAWAKLKFTPERARWVRREEWHPEQKTKEMDDGSYILEIPYADDRELIGDILKYGADVQVMEPKMLREQVKAALTNSLSHY